MEVSTTPTPATNGGIQSGAVGGGNAQLTQAFDRAIAEAQQTLATTTVSGADLRAFAAECPISLIKQACNQ